MIMTDSLELIETSTPCAVSDVFVQPLITHGFTADIIIVDDMVNNELLFIEEAQTPVSGKNSRVRHKMNKNIKVINTSYLTVLFEGESDKSKYELIDLYGKDIKVLYQQLYTTVAVNQSYDEALLDPNQVSMSFFSEDEFIEYINSLTVKPVYRHVSYSAKDLSNRKSEVSLKEVTRAPLNVGDFAMFLFTSMSQIKDGFFPINGLTKEQIDMAKYSLTMEDDFLSEYAKQNSLNLKSNSVKDQQIEVVLFIKGYTNAINNYIKMSSVKWISGRDDKPVKGLIKNNSNNKGCQIYMLIVNAQDPRNTNILTQVGYFI